MALGRFEGSRGGGRGARDHLRRSIGLFRRIEAPLWLARTQAALDELT